jgi:lipopolysaccharide export system permease protein
MQYEIEGRDRPNNELRRSFHYLGEGGRVYLADTFNQKTGTMYDIVVQYFEDNTLDRRIDARRAVWEDSVWVFHDGIVRSFHGPGDSVHTFTEMVVTDIEETPADLAQEEVDEENMNFRELRAYVDRVRRSGGRVEKHLVDLWFKLSFPLAGSIFVLIGIAFAAGKRKPSIATGFGVTLVVSFAYYIILRIGQTLGHNGVLPPLLAAQMGNIIFLVVGVLLLSRANR